MWDLIVSVPDHCLSFYFPLHFLLAYAKFPLGYNIVQCISTNKWNRSLNINLIK